jgi:asparagine synthase (glutamine-hydrolysing)
MCGIAGYRVIEGNADPWMRDLPQAVKALQYRGPDDEGFWFGAGSRVGLGHRRLSILDLSPLGHQPMVSACGNWIMVFNGEVYNFKALRALLEPLGHRFAGSGDSEVILAAFAQWGPDAVRRFIGMFAIALWHKASGELHLLRDRLGVKPLYYRWDGRVLCFGSELKALRAFSAWDAQIDVDALNDYLRYRYINDPRAIYRQVFKLPPAHRLVLHAHGRLEIQRYWNVLHHVGRSEGRGEGELADELEALMIDAFRYRMIADVPVGVFLSGGVDSSVVAAILQKHGSQQLKTFTIGFDDPKYDESPFAGELAQHLGTDHHSRILKVADAKRLLARWGELYDEPFGDPSGIATFMVSQVAAEQVKVALSADGGDELFSGYDTYTAMLRQWGWIKDIPQRWRDFTAAAVNAFGAAQIDAFFGARSGAAVGQLAAPVFARVAKFGARVDARGVGELFDTAIARFGREELARLTGRCVATRKLADEFPGTDGEKLCLWDLHNYMPGCILAKVDRATMAASIEGREPLIDHRLVEFAFSLPFQMRRGALGAKHLLKKVLYRYVPRSMLERPKHGFAVPVQQWLAGDLIGLVRDCLDPHRIGRQGVFNPDMVRNYLKRLDAGDATVRERVWLLVAFQLWYERWMGGQRRELLGS